MEEIRLCLDVWKVNETTVLDFEQNRSIFELLSKGQNFKWLNTVDHTASFWQITLAQEARKYRFSL